ncbi:TetR/AcrR family transcriptional regulator [Salinarimonas rosea]|uniref:TetR/AcrR family transcriptional regulator n=1 Tax=Salinarimonas rosea TaxID=552063 RepID=UPI00042710C7|nr:TetR/AcrR family transcriptional regulator [Salinarimonas rosea]
MVALHEELGPRNATISAIAQRAGVQRLTVYRHFPDEEALFEACTSHWLALNPPPDPRSWSDTASAPERARAALSALYGYYAATRRMWTVSYRDEAVVPALAGPMGAVRQYPASVADDLDAAYVSRDGDAFARRATIGHVVQFATFASLADQGLAREAAAQLAHRWTEAAGEANHDR